MPPLRHGVVLARAGVTAARWKHPTLPSSLVGTLSRQTAPYRPFTQNILSVYTASTASALLGGQTQKYIPGFSSWTPRS